MLFLLSITLAVLYMFTIHIALVQKKKKISVSFLFDLEHRSSVFNSTALVNLFAIDIKQN